MKPRRNGRVDGCRLAAFIPLLTPRLSLVAIAPEQVSAIHEIASDPEICHMAGWTRHENLAETQRFIASSMIAYAKGGHYDWALIRHSDQAFIGTCGFSSLDTTRGIAELGYLLTRKYWGQGYATEAAAQVMHFGFVQLGLRLIEASVRPENIASARVMVKLGMRYRENKRVTDPMTGESRPLSVWQLERQYWSRLVA